MRIGMAGLNFSMKVAIYGKPPFMLHQARVCLREATEDSAQTLFTRGQPIEGVEPVGYEHGGFKWGRHRVSSEGELDTAVEACRKAYERINESLAADEPTGWYAEVEQEDAERETVEVPNQGA